MGGDLVAALSTGAGHEVRGRIILREHPERLLHDVASILGRDDFEVLVATGGTGIAGRDLAADVFGRLYERSLPGFGESFRALSFAEIGSAAYLSRASAGIARGKVVYSLPGSPAAVRLGMERLIMPELGHVVAELRRTGGAVP
jgi:molybdenum cofactor biosynthesis protein B